MPLKLAADASDVAVGTVLLQEDDYGLDHSVCSMVEKVFLALILALQDFEIHVTASNSPVTVFGDYNPLVFLRKIKDKN